MLFLLLFRYSRTFACDFTAPFWTGVGTGEKSVFEIKSSLNTSMHMMKKMGSCRGYEQDMRAVCHGICLKEIDLKEYERSSVKDFYFERINGSKTTLT